MNTKKSVSVNEFRWFKLYLPIPMGCAIITTVNENEQVNAAPFAMVFPWNNDEKEPQLIVMAFSGWHTSQNIKNTGQFVVNWPEVHLIDKIMKTAVLYEEYASMSREERTQKIKLPIAFGAPVGEYHYFWGVPGEIVRSELEKR